MVHRFLVDLGSSGAILVAPVGAEESPAQMCPVNVSIDALNGEVPVAIRMCGRPPGHSENIVNGRVRAERFENGKFHRTVTSKSPEEPQAPAWKCRAPLHHRVPIRSDQIVAMNAGNSQSHSVTLWDIGNELWGDYRMGAMSIEHSELKYDLFATVLQKRDPSIEPIAAGTMDVADQSAINFCSDTYPLGLSVAFDNDQKTSIFGALNPSEPEQTMKCATVGGKLASERYLCQMDPGSVDSTISVGLEPCVEAQRQRAGAVHGTVAISPLSVNTHLYNLR